MEMHLPKRQRLVKQKNRSKGRACKDGKNRKNRAKKTRNRKIRVFFASGGSRNENQTGNLADTSYKM